jgi:hypothetical protein
MYRKRYAAIRGRVIPSLFARTGATPEAAALLQEHGGLLIDLATLATDLRE